MFCERCGQVLEEGKAFCKNCGAPAPKLEGAVAEPDIAPPAALVATQVRPPAGAPVGPPPPDAATSSAGASSVPLSPPPPVVPPPPPAAAAPSAAPGYGTGWQPPQGPSAQKGRGRLMWGIVAAAIIVLAGIGVGVYFGFFRDGGEAAITSSTKPGPTSTAGGVTDTTSGPATSTGGQTGTTVSGASTTQTIPGLNTTTSEFTTSESATSGSGTTDLTEASWEEYFSAAENLVSELEYDDGRIPELATEINNTAPKVPTWVRDELSTMLGSLDTLNVELAALDVPAAFEDSDYWLGEAVTHMGNRIYATMQGVETMWDTGKVSSANPFFDEGRTERDAYRGAMDKYYEFLPVE